MIERSDTRQKHDRLAAFLKAFGLHAHYCDSAGKANLLVVDAEGSGSPTHLIYRPRSFGPPVGAEMVLSAAAIDLGGSANPLVGALPEEMRFSLALEPQLQGLSDLVVAESFEAKLWRRHHPCASMRGRHRAGDPKSHRRRYGRCRPAGRTRPS